MTIRIEPIGVIRSPHQDKESCPIQPAAAAGVEGTVEVFAAFAAGLQDLEGFSHVYLLYAFDRAQPAPLLVKPFLDDEAHGIFATRHPGRPNGIGLSLVRLLRRDGARLTVEGVDVLDGTPLLDIKPYSPSFDRAEGVRIGWMEGKAYRPKPAGRE